MSNQILQYFAMGFGFLASCFFVSLACFVFLFQIDPIVKIAISGVMFILAVVSSIMFTIGADYNISYLLDIIVVYFILGFASFALYFIFFNKRI